MEIRNHRYSAARKEHVFLLRCEGLTYHEIGLRLGVGRNRARTMYHEFVWYNLRRAMRHTKVYVIK